MLPGRRADNGSIFVVQGPAPAGSLMEGGIAVTPLGAIYVSSVTGLLEVQPVVVPVVPEGGPL